MAERRRHASTIVLQTVLSIIAEADGIDYKALLARIQERFNCKERAAKDAVCILVKGGWIDALPLPTDRRRRRYLPSEKGLADLEGSFGRAALRRERRRYSTCLNTKARRRQLARSTQTDELVDTIEADALRLFSRDPYHHLIDLLGPGTPLFCPAWATTDG